MQQWLGFDLPAAFARRRIEARGLHISVHSVNDTLEMHAVQLETGEAHTARCNDDGEPPHPFWAAKLLAEAVGVRN